MEFSGFEGNDETWYPLDIATTDYAYQGTPSQYSGEASWIAAGVGAWQGAYAWIITNNAWESGSSDNLILQLVQSNTSGNNAWMHLPGGATRISVAPNSGAPWITNAEGVGFIGSAPQ